MSFMVLGEKRKVELRYFQMFMFGVIFVFILVFQKFFVSLWLHLVLIALELVGVYFIIKSFTKRELKE